MTQADEMRSAEAQNILRKAQSTLLFLALSKLSNCSIKNYLNKAYLQKIDEYSNKNGGDSMVNAETN